MLDDLLRRRSVQDDHIAEHGGELARLLGPSRRGDSPRRRRAGRRTRTPQRHRMLAAVVGLVAGIARRVPLVIVLDDLQYADRASLLLLREVLDARDAPVLRHRDHPRRRVRTQGALARTRPWPPRRAGHAGDPRGRARPRGHPRVLVAERDGEDTEDVARALQAETDGNALFVVELLRHQAESDGDRTAPPRSDRGGRGKRVRAALGDDAAHVARYAAALGRSFDFDLLVHVVDRPTDEVLDAVERVCAAGLAAEVSDQPGWFQFSHGVVQHALASELTDLRRRRLHHRAAEWLAGAGSRDASARASWRGTGRRRAATSSRRRCAALVEAGDRALEVVAFDDAVRAYEQALRLHERATPEPDTRTTELLLRLGDAERRAGLDGFSERLLRAAALAQDQGDTQRLVRAAIANSRGLTADFHGTDQRRVAGARGGARRGDAGRARRPRSAALRALQRALRQPRAPAGARRRRAGGSPRRR